MSASDSQVASASASRPDPIDSRSAILSRLSNVESFKAAPIRRDYVQSPTLPPNPAMLVQEMKETLEDYGAQVTICETEEALPDCIDTVLGDIPSVVVSGDAPMSWIKAIMAKHLVYLDSPAEPLGSDVLGLSKPL